MRENRKMTHDLCSMYRANDQAKAVLEHARKVYLDPDRVERKELRLCISCYHGGHQGGSMCTTVECAGCSTLLHSSNTYVDALCSECAKRRGCCKHCGADIHLKDRRKLTP